MEIGSDHRYTEAGNAVTGGILTLIDDIGEVVDFAGDPRAREIVRAMEDDLLGMAVESPADTPEEEAQEDGDTK